MYRLTRKDKDGNVMINIGFSPMEVCARLAHYEDLEEQGRLVILPCNESAELERDGEVFEADHWNHTLTAFRDEPSTRSGKQVALFSIQEAEAALAAAGGVPEGGGV